MHPSINTVPLDLCLAATCPSQQPEQCKHSEEGPRKLVFCIDLSVDALQPFFFRPQSQHDGCLAVPLNAQNLAKDRLPPQQRVPLLPPVMIMTTFGHLQRARQKPRPPTKTLRPMKRAVNVVVVDCCQALSPMELVLDMEIADVCQAGKLTNNMILHQVTTPRPPATHRRRSPPST